MSYKILIIEDNFEVRDNIAEILELADYQTLQAPNGKKGVELALENAPDLILCDVMMPELDGFGVLKILNKFKHTKNIPLIFLTAKSEKNDFRKGMGLGASDYITKPFDDTELLESIEMRLKKAIHIKASESESQNLFENKDEQAAKEKLIKLLDGKERRQFFAKDYIYREGSLARYIFYIKKGFCKISKSNDIGKQLSLQLYRTEQFFAIGDVLSEQNYSHDATALNELELVLIPKEEFLEVINKESSILHYVNRILVADIRQFQDKMVAFSYSSVRRKVAQALVELDRLFQGNPIDLSRDEIAEIAGIAKETTIRTLSEFRSDKLITSTGSVIHILNLNALEQIPD